MAKELDSVWNHRVMRLEAEGNAPAIYGIYEVFYTNGVVRQWTKEPVEVSGDSVKDLEKTLKWMREAVRQPVLDYRTGKEYARKKP